jgi:hypothetical protein
VAPVGVLVNEPAATCAPGQTVSFAGAVVVGSGLTVIE